MDEKARKCLIEISYFSGVEHKKFQRPEISIFFSIFRRNFELNGNFGERKHERHAYGYFSTKYHRNFSRNK